MKSKKCVSGWIAGVALACVGYCLSVSNVQGKAPKYNISTIPVYFAFPQAINNKGEVSGFGFSEYDVNFKPFLYENEKSVLLGTLGGKEGYAYGMNDATQIVGTAELSNGVSHAFLYANGTMVDLGSLTGDEQGISSALAVNNNGQAVGYSSANLTYIRGINHAVAFWKESILDLGSFAGETGSSQAYDINNNIGENGLGQIVGTADIHLNSHATSHAFLYSNGTMTDIHAQVCPNLDENAYSRAILINDVGQIVGYCNDNKKNMAAFIYNLNNGDHAFIKFSKKNPLILKDINNHGEVIGLSASVQPMLYRKGKTYNVNDLILQGHSMSSALNPAAINDAGEIVAGGYINGKYKVILLTPISE